MIARMFIPAPNANDAGTNLIKSMQLAPAFLVERFGAPLPGDGAKCTGRYTFVAGDGTVFTVYEYKSTAAYLDDEEDALAPDEFWRSRDEHELSIGGRGGYGDDSADAFAAWLSAEYQQWVGSA